MSIGTYNQVFPKTDWNQVDYFTSLGRTYHIFGRLGLFNQHDSKANSTYDQNIYVSQPMVHALSRPSLTDLGVTV